MNGAAGMPGGPHRWMHMMPYALLGLAVAACHPKTTTPPWLNDALIVGVAILAPVVAMMTVHAIGRAVTNRQASRGPIFPI